MGDALLKRLVGRVAASVRGDAELLERFAFRRDEAAFEALLARHGPMVLGVCRRVLGNGHDAEDAFQAVFLVLARKAETVRPPGRVGSWLHGVARRTALEAKRAAAKRRSKEARAVPYRNEEPDADLAEVLDLELAELPESYREVIVLSDLEGRPRREVAGLLGCPEGTVASRLARARAALAARLSRHGLTAPVSAERALVPAPLAVATLKGALGGDAGVVPARVVALAEEVIRIMFTKKMTKAALLLLVALLATGAGLASFGNAAPRPEAQAEKPPEAKAAPKPADDKAMDGELKKLQGMWVMSASGPGGPAGGWTTVMVISRDTVTEYNTPAMTPTVWALKIDAAKHPKTIDLTDRANKCFGVYEVAGDTLKMRLAYNKPRPTELKPVEQVVVYKRQPLTVAVSNEVEEAYQGNEAFADERYTGKQVAVLGIVDRVRKHPAGYAVWLEEASASGLAAEAPRNPLLMFVFPEAARKDLARLKQRQTTVIVEGRCKGRVREGAGKEAIAFSDGKLIKVMD